MYKVFDFEEFFNYFLKYGNVKTYFVTEEGYPLGQYESRIRAFHLKLFPNQIEKLNQHNFNWGKERKLVFRILKRKNSFNFNLFLEHYKQFGDVKVAFVCPDGYKLGRCIVRVRGSLVKISEEEKQILNDLGFKWKINKKFDFDEFFGYFLKYHNVQVNFVTPDGYKLGYVQNRIRCGDVFLTKAQKEKLKNAHFYWGKHRVNHTIEN